MISSLYIHVPFCAAKCDYCDFYSIPVKNRDERIGRYIEEILRSTEAELERFRVESIPSIYIGGGSPSMLGAQRMTALLLGLSGILSRRSISFPPEFTVEANPESADRDFLSCCRDSGVTRLSLGLQSFCESTRRQLGRAGESASLTRSLALASGFFPGNFNADLMAALPGQDERELLSGIEKLLEYAPSHVSLYSLTVEEETPLARRLSGSKLSLPPAEEADRIWIAGRDALEEAGYEQYEVSNFALPGKRSLHNIRYWRMENWLGTGPGASGTIIDEEAGTGMRYTVPADLDVWLLGQGDEAAGEALDRFTLMKESILMGFRCIEGPDPFLFRRRFGLDIEEAIPKTLEKWRGRGFVKKNASAMTGEGLLFLDSFVIDAFNELETILPAGRSGSVPKIPGGSQSSLSR
ncbi:MAG: radical SAM family heme chaperone HemW [Treponema sp.]|jgi:oxygen-independent coproporphyrinogen-3 oxidase|nr:radical SAM family heme chaperone HemW [Treponema sp.]